MKENDFTLENFLDKYHISLSNYDFNVDIKAFIAEMQNGLDSESSMPMNPTFIESDKSLPVDKKVLVIDAGGTNLRAAIVSFSDDNKSEITHFRKRGMPGIEKEIGRDAFFDEIAGFVCDLAKKVDRIGFCFSYPMVKYADKDGRLTKFTKEVKAPEVEGELIGANLIEALKKRRVCGIEQIVLLNDTVAALLAGKTSKSGEEFDDYIGLILGTGANASYSEKNCNIGKLKGLPDDGFQIINIEAGNCGIFPSGLADELFRADTVNPQAYKFEKMVGGGYIGDLWLSVLRLAAREGFFSRYFCEALEKEEEAGTVKYNASVLNNFIKTGIFPEPFCLCADENDIETALNIGRALIKRSAYLISVMLSAIMIKTGKGRDSSRPIFICADGTTFWKLDGLREGVEANLKRFLKDENIYFSIGSIEDAPVIGAAVAGLTNL